jgi:hypothetical protein
MERYDESRILQLLSEKHPQGIVTKQTFLDDDGDTWQEYIVYSSTEEAIADIIRRFSKVMQRNQKHDKSPFRSDGTLISFSGNEDVEFRNKKEKDEISKNIRTRCKRGIKEAAEYEKIGSPQEIDLTKVEEVSHETPHSEKKKEIKTKSRKSRKKKKHDHFSFSIDSSSSESSESSSSDLFADLEKNDKTKSKTKGRRRKESEIPKLTLQEMPTEIPQEIVSHTEKISQG